MMCCVSCIVRRPHCKQGAATLHTATSRMPHTWMGALVSCALSTSRTICESTVPPPTRVARTSRTPGPRLIVPPTTSSPSALRTGDDSPVTIASSTSAAPACTMPSVGMAPPGKTRSRSPGETRASGTLRRASARAPSAGATPSSRVRSAGDARCGCCCCCCDDRHHVASSSSSSSTTASSG